jgi:hypothetical protein
MKTTDMIRNAVRASFKISCAASVVFAASAGAQLPSNEKPAPAPIARPAAKSTATCKSVAGYAFDHPTNWAISEDPSGSVLLVPAGKGQNEAYLLGTSQAYGVKSADDPRAVAIAEAEMAKLFPSLRRSTAPYKMKTGVGAGVSFDLEGKTDRGNPINTRLFLTVNGDTAVVMFAIAPKDRIESNSDALDAIFSSIRIDNSAPAADSSPLAREWTQRLSGKKLTKLSGYSSGSSGGYNSETIWILNANGRFTFNSSSSVAIYVDGANGGSSSRSRNAGTWRIIEQDGAAVLELRSDAGVTRSTMTFRDGKTFMNGGRVYVTQP